MQLYLYLIRQGEATGWDTYDSAVVVAASAHEARGIHPSGKKPWPGDDNGTWCRDPEKVTAERIGVASSRLERGQVVCSSFSAG